GQLVLAGQLDPAREDRDPELFSRTTNQILPPKDMVRRPDRAGVSTLHRSDTTGRNPPTFGAQRTKLRPASECGPGLWSACSLLSLNDPIADLGYESSRNCPVGDAIAYRHNDRVGPQRPVGILKMKLVCQFQRKPRFEENHHGSAEFDHRALFQEMAFPPSDAHQNRNAQRRGAREQLSQAP